MLKYIFMDVSPYFVDAKQLFIESWKIFKNSQEDKKYNIDFLDKIENLIEDHPDFIDDVLFWKQEISQEQYDELKEKFNSIFNLQLRDYFNKNPLNQALKAFVDDSIDDENSEIILITSNNWLSDFINFCKLDLDLTIKTIDSNYFIDAQYLINYASANNVLCNEILCITQVKETIRDLEKNDIFCVTINSKHTNDSLNNKLLVLNSINDLVYSNIYYNFYSINSENSDNDL